MKDKKHKKMLVFSGRMCSGKDFVALKAGYTCVSIAEPLYRLTKHYLGVNDKKIPEVRAFMQALGAWGRGEPGKSEKVSGVTRSEVVEAVRAAGSEMTGLKDVRWEEFGTKKTFWLSSAAAVAERMAEAGKKVAITNARFPEELETLKQRGFRHVHVMCSEASRLNRAGREYTPAIDEDVTEQMAISLNEKVASNGVESIGAAAVVWSDFDPSPHQGMATVQSFVQREASLTFLARAPLSISPYQQEKGRQGQ